jgi:excinuclease ABC subunit A
VQAHRDELPARRGGALRGLRRRRFTPETLEVTYKGRSIGDVLNMSVDEAVDFFTAHPAIHHALQLLQDVGLGYLRLGQPSPTLSGGEAQRIKLVTELAKAAPMCAAGRRKAAAHAVRAGRTHRGPAHGRRGEADPRAAPAGGRGQHSVIVIEHNLDVIAEADWLIDMGPEGGDGGGRVVGQGVAHGV